MKSTPSQEAVLANLGITTLNKMQLAAQQAITPGTDTFLVSPTGSGKTVGFLLPVLQLLDAEESGVQCLILSPSRELALQIEQVWKKMATGYKVNVCYGGHDMATEIKNLSNPPALLIGTPGRIADHIDRKSVSLDGVHTLVLDEFDKSLTLGFQEEMAFIIQGLTSLRQRILVSATSGIAIPDFVGLNRPAKLTFRPDEDAEPALTVKLVKAGQDKFDTLFRLLGTLDSEPAIIFCNLRDTTDQIRDTLTDRGIRTMVYHGGLEQDDRERALLQFRNGSVRYLVTTDLAARGLDIPDMKYVVHFQLPQHPHEFTHRNGRTARMETTGTAFVLMTSDEPRPFFLPEKMEEVTLPAKTALPKPPDFVTVYVSGGKKNKLNKVDIVGFFSQKGQLAKEDLGRIDVQDFISFAAVRATKLDALLTRIQHEKMKGKKYKIEVAR